MSKPGKISGPQAGPEGATDLPFEQALDRLVAIVESMESDDLPLEKLLANYEEGMRMYQQCQARLAAAELKVQQIEKDAAGRLLAKPVEFSDNKSEV